MSIESFMLGVRDTYDNLEGDFEHGHSEIRFFDKRQITAQDILADVSYRSCDLCYYIDFPATTNRRYGRRVDRSKHTQFLDRACDGALCLDTSNCLHSTGA